MKSKPRILIVDDAPENVQLLAEMLQAEFLPLTASSGEQALNMVIEEPAPEVILLDVMMPGMNGYEVCTRLKSDPRTCDIPIIFVSALTDKNEEHKGLELGGADFITRPFNARLVKTRIRYQLEIKRYRSIHPVPPAPPALHPAAAAPELLSEQSERKRMHEEFRRLNESLEAALAGCTAQHAAAQEQLQQESARRREAEAEVFELNRKAELQKIDLDNANQELEALSFSISHDLRAPLRHLLGFSGALMEDYGDKLEGPAGNFLSCIVKAATKLDSQVEALLGLSRVSRQQLSFARVDLSHMVRECAGSLQDSAPGRRAVFSIAYQLTVRADPSLLRTAIDNLMGNAWKYTKDKDAANIEFGKKQEGDEAVYYLRDNGAGFDMRYAGRLFGAFQRMHKDSEFEGTGVGLATVQRIIRMHGGKIWADATVDGGATFFFTLPE
jgi:signal transduction histidine kinase